jgi:hypothetical protein
MAKLGRFKLPQQFMVGFMAGVFSPVLVWLVSLVQGLAQGFINALQGRGSIVTGTELGTKLLQMLGGNWVVTLPDMLVAGIGGGILVMVGTWVYNMDWSPDAIPMFKSTPMTKLALVLFYASILATLVLTAFALPAVPVLLTMLVNSIVTAWFVTEVLQDQLGIV